MDKKFHKNLGEKYKISKLLLFIKKLDIKS